MCRATKPVDCVTRNQQSQITTLFKIYMHFYYYSLLMNYFSVVLFVQIAPEEFSGTVCRINQILRKMVALNFKWLLFGCLCCCCTVGCSVWPVICLNKRTKRTLDKALGWENRQLYHKVSEVDFELQYSTGCVPISK